MDAEDEAEETEDSFVLNILDEQNPFDELTLSLLKKYVQAFFGIPILLKQTPATYISPPGILALSETTNCPLKQREPRPGQRERSTKVGGSVRRLCSYPEMFAAPTIIMRNCFA